MVVSAYSVCQKNVPNRIGSLQKWSLKESQFSSSLRLIRIILEARIKYI